VLKSRCGYKNHPNIGSFWGQFTEEEPKLCHLWAKVHQIFWECKGTVGTVFSKKVSSVCQQLLSFRLCSLLSPDVVKRPENGQFRGHILDGGTHWLTSEHVKSVEFRSVNSEDGVRNTCKKARKGGNSRPKRVEILGCDLMASQNFRPSPVCGPPGQCRPLTGLPEWRTPGMANLRNYRRHSDTNFNTFSKPFKHLTSDWQRWSFSHTLQRRWQSR